MLRSALLVLAILVAVDAPRADPLDLGDPTPRWVKVAFETSPRSLPGQTNTVYTPSVPAWFEFGDEPGTARVRISGDLVERTLLPGDDPVPGSFGDFVWVFDVRTGDVLSASLEGTVHKLLDWGLFSSRVETRIAVRMSTVAPAGFEHSRHLLGNEFFGYCSPAAMSGDCTIVNPSPYRVDTGYVNAVGVVTARSALVEVDAFSPLGEAIFSEASESRWAVASPPSREKAAQASVSMLQAQEMAPGRRSAERER